MAAKKNKLVLSQDGSGEQLKASTSIRRTQKRHFRGKMEPFV